MKLLISIALLLGLTLLSHPLMAAEGGAVLQAANPAGAHAEAVGHEAHEGLPLYAVEIGRLGPLPVTNSMVVTWLVALLVILSARLATRRMQAVPSGGQNFWEWLVEALHDFLEGVIGPRLVKKTFWFFATIFILILACNWFGLIPGVGTIGWNVQLADGTREWHPLLRGANADLNLTFAMAMFFFACWVIWALQVNGLGGFLAHIFGVKGDTTGLLKWLLVLVFFVVGILEVISICFRPVSLSFRLFGNIYAGENMLEAMSTLVPSLGWLIPIPFYFLKVLVGVVQALVFMLLTAVFTLLICEEHEEGHEASPH